LKLKILKKKKIEKERDKDNKEKGYEKLNISNKEKKNYDRVREKINNEDRDYIRGGKKVYNEDIERKNNIDESFLNELNEEDKKLLDIDLNELAAQTIKAQITQSPDYRELEIKLERARELQTGREEREINISNLGNYGRKIALSKMLDKKKEEKISKNEDVEDDDIESLVAQEKFGGKNFNYDKNIGSQKKV